jgi:hypothetical protein
VIKKERGRPFAPGNTFGRGRPKGSRNKTKLSGQHLLDQFAEHLTSKCISMAMDGNPSALRMCMDRINARHPACIQLSLPAIRSAADIGRAAEKITNAIRKGGISPDEGETMMRILDSCARVIESVEFEKRLEMLEQQSVQSEEGTL